MNKNKTFEKWFLNMKEQIELKNGEVMSEKDTKILRSIMQRRYDSLPKSNKHSKFIK